MATAEAGDGREPPGLGPRIRRSKATPPTCDMTGGGGEDERKGPLVYVLSLTAAALPLPVAISCLDAAVPRKARSRRCLPRTKASAWCAFRLPVPSPEEATFPVLPPSAAENPPKEAKPPRPHRLRVPPPPDLDAPTPATKRPAKRARRCLHCGAAETPKWRSGPMGQSTLCNACGVRLKAAGALREHRPPPATARTVAEPPPPAESPVSVSPPNSPIWEPQVRLPDVYLVRRQPSTRHRHPPQRKEAAPAPAIYLVKKKKPSKKPWRPRTTGKRCLHCGSSSTPQWREGPMGRGTLCNACGVRYRQGRLLPEYRPVGSPTFVPSEHANRHCEVLQLRRQRQDKNHHPPPPEQPQTVDDNLPDPRVGGNGDSADAPGCGGDDMADVLQQRQVMDPYPPTPLHQPLSVDSIADPGVGSNDKLINAPSSLDSLLLDGPSAPLIVDGDEFLIS
ncbi:pollen-specific leucine-rich repeat extensin-like protein 2 [Phragmites australis]|uniref:pollen-specific leucine-rich repeat extensin-like protein 2 n=1 Tax=Phragmites australis TaxID=29695 RepID=UPI002D77C0D8|nr:pollen-specific leucine-rich repeat extensin-like protein 2 [Phragmites australis]